MWLRTIFRVLHGVNVPACYLEVCCLLLSFVFPAAWKGCPLTAASQPGRSETSFVWTTFSRSFSMPSKQCDPKEGCLVAQSAAECCCCLRSTDERPVQLSRLHAELRLRLPVPSSTCRFRLFSIAAGLFLPACATCV